ncbi:MAG: copper resistance protein B [Pseudomonadota bacterium]|nr:copper resistance protein B [Pseudomonadota bacterium]
MSIQRTTARLLYIGIFLSISTLVTAQMDHSQMDHSQMDHGSMGHATMQGGQAPADARSPDYSHGRQSIHGGMLHNHSLWGVQVNTAEWQHHQHNLSTAGAAWYGTDTHQAVLDWALTGRSQLEEAEIAFIWRQPLWTFWNYDLGLQHDYAHAQANRSALLAGINGLLPYRIEFDTKLLLDDAGRSTLHLDADYDLRLTQRLAIQPELKLTAYGRDDPTRLRGAGLSQAAIALRLRYEWRRTFAPYLGVQYQRKLRKTADYARQQQQAVQTTDWMTGIQFWF